MEVCEEHLVRPDLLPLRLDGLLDLHDHLGPRPHFVREGHQLGASRRVEIVRKATSLTCTGLQQDLVARSGQRFGTGRRKGYAVFLTLDFLRDSDQHVMWGWCGRGRAGSNYRIELVQATRRPVGVLG